MRQRVVRMLFDITSVGPRPPDSLSFLIEILQSSTEYSMIGTGLDSKIQLWNEGARRLYGYLPEEVLGKPPAEPLDTLEDIAAGREWNS